MGRSWVTDANIPRYHKFIVACGKCGRKYEDPRVYEFVDRGWDFFIDNLEGLKDSPAHDWECPEHGRRNISLITNEYRQQITTTT